MSAAEQKWSKGKSREKVANKIQFEEELYNRFIAEVPKVQTIFQGREALLLFGRGEPADGTKSARRWEGRHLQPQQETRGAGTPKLTRPCADSCYSYAA